MRIFGVILSFLVSFSGFAGTTILLEAENYSLTVTLESGASGLFSGTVEAETNQGLCTGSYEVDFTKNTMNIVFDGLDGPGSGGGCHNSSLEVDINMNQYQRLKAGETVEVIFRSINFYWYPRTGTVRIIEPEA